MHTKFGGNRLNNNGDLITVTGRGQMSFWLSCNSAINQSINQSSIYYTLAAKKLD